MERQRVLITGGAGFIGKHLASALADQGHDVAILDKNTDGFLYGSGKSDARIIVRQCDMVRDADFKYLLYLLQQTDVVFHLAARVTIRGSMEQCQEDFKDTLVSTMQLLDAIRRLKNLNKNDVKKLIFTSSMAVYGECHIDSVAEYGDINPLSFYGVAKRTAEQYILLAARELGFKPVILRLFNTYGPGQAYSPYIGVITIFINQLLRGERPTIFGDGTQIRDFVSVHDVVDALIKSMEWDHNSFGIAEPIFNVGSGTGVTVQDIAAMLIRRIRPDIVPVYMSRQAGELERSIANISRARVMLGYEPRHTLADSLDEIIAAVASTIKNP